ncbi:hypothetical protein FHX82_005961 [Amycolatopsis bartoniae]|uniref:hypothetical protein n=1 Tax=Amycolatopsis bartoniae TaxID=941986 RepID=UPI001606CF99|nr:hypothetical protein [Amycolatopsis bartoniae]MBB2938883.1 hypothetical protein [Amycolatopsis bartoniae]
MPPAKKPANKLSVGLASILAAAALVVGGSVGFVIGHSTGSGSGTPSSQFGPGGAGGYGPGGGMGGFPGQQQDQSGTADQGQGQTT